MPVSGIVFVQAPELQLPPDVDPGRTHYTIWWEAWDGSNWSLSDSDSGLVMMRGARGFGNITIEHHRDDHAALPGSRWRDYRALNRDIFLPVHIYSDGDSDAWVKHNRAFWKTMRAGKTGWLHIIHPDGEHRRIQARYEKGGEEAFELDPAFYGWATYGIYLVAEQPYWERVGHPPQSWRTNDPIYFLGGGAAPGNAPPFGVSDTANTSTATITNPGDVEVYGVVTLNGPLDSVTIGLDGRVVGWPTALLSGEWVKIDMRPDQQFAVDQAGNDVTDQLTSFDFAPIPPGVDVPLEITVVGVGGSVTMEITPLFEWGLS